MFIEIDSKNILLSDFKSYKITTQEIQQQWIEKKNPNLLVRILLLGSFLHLIYSKLAVNIDYGNGYGLMVQAAILILFFVLYKNELQFSGMGWSTWFFAKRRKKLSKKVSKLLIFTSIVLLILPPILTFFFH